VRDIQVPAARQRAGLCECGEPPQEERVCGGLRVGRGAPPERSLRGHGLPGPREDETSPLSWEGTTYGK